MPQQLRFKFSVWKCLLAVLESILLLPSLLIFKILGLHRNVKSLVFKDHVTPLYFELR